MTTFDAKAFLKTLSSAPGVYRMLDAQGKLLYVGKARNLKRRVASYFQRTTDNAKTRAMVAQIAGIEVTVTHTETEALLLENNLIKQHRPRYNITLRDDKSYPYVHLTAHDYPRLAFYRGARKERGQFFGPYPSAAAVRETLSQLQKLFQLRPCNDTFFANRSRPCLQYQIGRCSAPCVGLISAEDYARDVQHAVLFLEGRNTEVLEALGERMENAALAQNYELAAQYRDQIAQLRQTREQQHMDGRAQDVDVLAAVSQGGVHCVALVAIRGGRNLGAKPYFPRGGETDPEEIMSAFLPQHYLGRDVPHEILSNVPVEDSSLLEQALREQTGHAVAIRHQMRGIRARWMDMARRNAEQALATRLVADATLQQRFAALQKALQLDEPPVRLECFDISHTQGEATVASCVVFGLEGPLKSDYRRFNIEDITPGDDYAAMRQALMRRYLRLQKGEGILPDVLLIDGGKGQVAEALAMLEELQVSGVQVVGVAKGPGRKAGYEQLFLGATKKPLQLPPDSPALHLIQQVRDEAHRFAISGHRGRRAKARTTSPLEAIEGLGPKRRQQLLKAFGGLQGVARAGVDELMQVHGISRELARRVYDVFHTT